MPHASRDERLEGWLYDWENSLTLERQNLDIDFYRMLAARRWQSPVDILEFACGTGRVALPLARAGHRVRGVDNSPSRLLVARDKMEPGLEIAFEYGDMRCYDGEAAFDLVLIPYSSFLLLASDAARISCLRSIRQSMRPGGLAVVDLSPNFLHHPETERAPEAYGLCAPLNARVELSHTVRQDYVQQITRIRKCYRITSAGGSVEEFATDETWYTLKVLEMRWLAGQSGLRVADILGTYHGDPLLRDGEYQTSAYKNIYLLEEA
ncbi:MAG TPA: class I SAM-dependent methyltransferase [Candidatus Kapabacteria bacterium]|nr:class I SAM-dependent methyltransferase [Candidatus Kapabacteria bacterium]